MDENTLMMLKAVLYFITGLGVIFALKKRSESGIEDILIDDEVKKTALEIEIRSVIMPKFLNIDFSTKSYSTNYALIYITDNEIIMEQTGFGFVLNRQITILPLILCSKGQNLRKKYPNNYIANIVDMKISSWNEVNLTIKMIQHSSKTIKMCLVFKSNKDENTNKLKNVIEEMIKDK